MSPKNVGESVHTRLVHLAQNREEEPQLGIMRYVNERFLVRLGLSEHRNRFTLKGAMLLTALVPEAWRATRDLDFLGRGAPDVTAVADAFRDVVRVPVEDDGIVFFADTIATTPQRASTSNIRACGW